MIVALLLAACQVEEPRARMEPMKECQLVGNPNQCFEMAKSALQNTSPKNIANAHFGFLYACEHGVEGACTKVLSLRKLGVNEGEITGDLAVACLDHGVQEACQELLPLTKSYRPTEWKMELLERIRSGANRR